MSEPDDRCIASIETALYALGRRLKQARLHDHFTRVAGVDIDQAGLAVLYALHGQKAGLRVKGGIITDEFGETSTPGIYAAGEVARASRP